jgi:hypothetical protein
VPLLPQWRRVKEQLLEVEPVVSVVGAAVSVLGAIASMFIAFFAYQIDLKVQANAAQSAQMDRALILAQGILSDEEFRTLGIAATGVEIEVVGRMPQEAEDPAQVWKLTHAEVLGGHMDDQFRKHLSTLSRYVTLANNCREWATSGPGGSVLLCHAESILALTAESFADLYVQLRPALACDSAYQRLGEKLGELIEAYHASQSEGDVASGRVPPLAYDDPVYCETYLAALR